MTEQREPSTPPNSQRAPDPSDALDDFADPNLKSYLEGFGDALDSAAITCARCASLEQKIAQLEAQNERLFQTAMARGDQ